MNNLCELCGDLIEDSFFKVDEEGNTYHDECYDQCRAVCPRCHCEVASDEMDTIPDLATIEEYCFDCRAEYEDTRRWVEDELLAELADLTYERWERY